MSKSFVFKNMKIGDIFIIVAVLLLSLSVFWALGSADDSDMECIITVDNEVVERFYFDQTTEKQVTIDGDYENIIVVADGKISVKSSSCPNQVCVHHAPISKANQAIICLPNKAVVEIVSKKDSEVDVVA